MEKIEELEKKATLWINTLKKTGTWLLKTAVIFTICTTIGGPVMATYVKPIINEVVKNALAKELGVIMTYMFGDLERFVFKQHKKIVEKHNNIYLTDIDAAITFCHVIEKQYPEKYTFKISSKLSVLEEYYRNHTS